MTYECPHCRAPVSRWRMMSPAWARWNCPACGSEIGINWRWRLGGIAVWVPTILFVLGVLRVTRYGTWFGIATLLVIGLPLFWAFDRIALYTPRGFRCRGCGYDLRGQVAPQCPECGRELDEDERAQLGAGFAEPPPVRKRRDRFVFYIVVFVPMFLLLVWGIILQRRMSRVVGPPPLTLPAASSPATQATP